MHALPLGKIYPVNQRIMKLNYTKFVAGAAIAGLLLPTVALAHDDRKGENRGLHLGAFIGLGHMKGGSDDDSRGHKSLHASSTVKVKVHASSTVAKADAIERKGTRLVAIADFMGSLSDDLAARIASSSLSASSTAQATLNDYNTSIAGAKIKAGAAVSLASGVSTSTASSTADSLLSQARDNLKAARDFLKQAQKDVMFILRAIFKADVNL